MRKVSKVGTVSALELTRRDDGKSFIFCSFLYRDNAFRCIHDAWLMRASAGEEDKEGNEMKDMTSWRERKKHDKPADNTAHSLTMSNLIPPPHAGLENGKVSTTVGSTGTNRGDGRGGLRRSSSAPDLTLDAITLTHADTNIVLCRELPRHTPLHVFHTLYDPEGNLLRTHLTTNCRAEDVCMSPRTPFGRGGRHVVAERFISYRTPTMYTFPNMPKFCTVQDTQRYVNPCANYDDGRGGSEDKAFIMQSSAVMIGPPYANTFTIETNLWVSAATEGSGSIVKVACNVAWKKVINSWLQGLIFKGAKDQLKRSYSKMLDLAEMRLSNQSVSDSIRVARSTTFHHARSRSVGLAKPPKSAFVGAEESSAACAAAIPSGTVLPDTEMEPIQGFATRLVAAQESEDKTPLREQSCMKVAQQQRLPPDTGWFIPAAIILFTLVLVLLAFSRDLVSEGESWPWCPATFKQVAPSRPRLLPQSTIHGAMTDTWKPVTRKALKLALNRFAEDDKLMDALVAIVNDEI